MTVGLVVRLVAKPDRADDVRELLKRSLPHAQAEEGTPIWMAIETGPTEFWIVDAHPDDAARQTHLDGPIAAAIVARADELLAEAPDIKPSILLAAKP